MSDALVTGARATTRRCGALLGIGGALLLTASCRKPDTLPPEGEARAQSAATPSVPSSAVPPPASASASAAPSPLAKLVPVTPDKAVPPALQSMTAVEGCSLDQIGGHPTEPSNPVGADEPLHFTGWAADVSAGSVPPVVILEFAGATRYFAPALRITKRLDVAQTFKHPELVDAGYDAVVSFAGVVPGTYAVKIDSVTASGAVLQCDTRRKIELK
jgi:hypothetical protein